MNTISDPWSVVSSGKANRAVGLNCQIGVSEMRATRLFVLSSPSSPPSNNIPRHRRGAQVIEQSILLTVERLPCKYGIPICAACWIQGVLFPGGSVHPCMH